MDYLSAGSPTVLSFIFRNTPTFPVAPTYEVILENDDVILSGSCTISTVLTGGWDVSITIPSNYVTDDGGETITIEVFGVDSFSKVRSVEKQYLLTDAADGYTPVGLIVREGFAFTDSIVLNGPNYSGQVSITLEDATGNVLLGPITPAATKVQRILPADGVPERFVSPKFQDYKYTFPIAAQAVVYPVSTYGAHQLNYTLPSGASLSHFESHPVYRVNRVWIKHLTSLRMYLDKARLTEIDPTLQWRDDELCQSLLEGASYINVNPPTLTYWVIESFPEALSTLLWMAAAYHALNARYLAEGFTAFEFQGLSTNLTVDRKEAITYKIEEIKAWLEANLAKIKQMAVQAVGTGTSSTGEQSNTTGKALGALGLTISPAMNINKPYSGFCR